MKELGNKALVIKEILITKIIIIYEGIGQGNFNECILSNINLALDKLFVSMTAPRVHGCFSTEQKYEQVGVKLRVEMRSVFHVSLR